MRAARPPARPSGSALAASGGQGRRARGLAHPDAPACRPPLAVAGGPAADTVIGFGTEQAAEPASEVPAFLKAGNVAAVYKPPGGS